MNRPPDVNKNHFRILTSWCLKEQALCYFQSTLFQKFETARLPENPYKVPLNSFTWGSALPVIGEHWDIFLSMSWNFFFKFKTKFVHFCLLRILLNSSDLIGWKRLNPSMWVIIIWGNDGKTSSTMHAVFSECQWYRCFEGRFVRC